MKVQQIAINSVSTRHADIAEALNAYAFAGFTQVEFCIPHIKQYLANGHTLADVKALLAKHKLRSIGGFETTVQSFGDAEAIRKNHQLFIDNAALIAELGGGTIVCGTDGDANNNIDTLKAIGKTMGKLVKQMHKDVKLAVEFNWSPVVKSIRSAAIVVEEAADARVGILFDPAHYHCTPMKMEDLTDRVCKMIGHVHVDDMRDVPGDRANCNSDRVLPGKGILPLKAMFDRIEAAGYKGAFSIEMFNDDLWAMPPIEASKYMYESMLTLAK